MARTNIVIRGVIEAGVLYVYGSQTEQEKAKGIISSLLLTGNEGVDRLIIQRAIDDYGLKAAVLYDGNIVYPYGKHVREYQRLRKSNNLGRMTKAFYEFLHLACGDIAHYNYGGYVDYYNNDFSRVNREIIQTARTPAWHTDVQNIFDAIQQ